LDFLKHQQLVLTILHNCWRVSLRASWTAQGSPTANLRFVLRTRPVSEMALAAGTSGAAPSSSDNASTLLNGIVYHPLPELYGK